MKCKKQSKPKTAVSQEIKIAGIILGNLLQYVSDYDAAKDRQVEYALDMARRLIKKASEQT